MQKSTLTEAKPEGTEQRLFKVYSDYSVGKVDCQKMLYAVEKECGHVTPELRNYMQKNPNSA